MAKNAETWDVVVAAGPQSFDPDAEEATEVTVTDHTGAEHTLKVGEPYTVDDAETAAWVAEKAQIQVGAGNVTIEHGYPGEEPPTVVPATVVQETPGAMSTKAAPAKSTSK